MLRALACVLSFAATCLAAPALAEALGALLAPGAAALAGYAGTRLLLSGAMASLARPPPVGRDDGVPAAISCGDAGG
ncbi:MAG TPA: hypothetical protein VM582_03380 [Candidatus Thermoplasmatota archaeon]|nr:hypothetical protein [Candidatus Thermoplasmatota archaeon]